MSLYVLFVLVQHLTALPDIGETLTLAKISRNQTGNYSCVADNGVPPIAKKTIKVDVLCT